MFIPDEVCRVVFGFDYVFIYYSSQNSFKPKKKMNNNKEFQ